MLTPCSTLVTNSTKEDLHEQIPTNLRVLLVDDDRISLTVIWKMLASCLYHVTTCNNAETALSILRENKFFFDIIITDIYMPKMDGFQLLEVVKEEIGLPVILLSADDSEELKMKAAANGACDYLVKPVEMDKLRKIGRHVVSHRNENGYNNMVRQLENSEGSVVLHNNNNDAGCASSTNEGNGGSSRKRKAEDHEGDDESSTIIKKPRVVWSEELHNLFEKAVNHLTIEKAVPKKILQLMNVPGLTREKVASHLQKHRLQLKRMSVNRQATLCNRFMNPQEQTFPPQSVGPFQDSGFHRSTAILRTSMPVVDRRNLFQGLPKPTQQVNAHLHHCSQPIGSVNMQFNNAPAHGNHYIQSNPSQMQMAQMQSRGPMVNAGNNHSHVPMLPSYFQQPNLRNGYDVRNHYFENGPRYNPMPHSSPTPNFPLNQAQALQGYSFPAGSISSIPNQASSGQFHEEAKSDLNNSVSSMPSYDIFADIENLDFTDHSEHINGIIDITPQMLTSPLFSINETNGPDENAYMNMHNVGEHQDSLIVDDSFRLSSEGPSSVTENVDTINDLLKHEKGTGPV